MENSNTRPAQFCQWFLVYNTLILNRHSRINLVNDQAAETCSSRLETSFQVLFRDDARRAEVRRIIHDAFDLFFTIDPTHLGQLRLDLPLALLTLLLRSAAFMTKQSSITRQRFQLIRPAMG